MCFYHVSFLFLLWLWLILLLGTVVWASICGISKLVEHQFNPFCIKTGKNQPLVWWVCIYKWLNISFLQFTIPFLCSIYLVSFTINYQGSLFSVPVFLVLTMPLPLWQTLLRFGGVFSMILLKLLSIKIIC